MQGGVMCVLRSGGVNDVLLRIHIHQIHEGKNGFQAEVKNFV